MLLLALAALLPLAVGTVDAALLVANQLVTDRGSEEGTAPKELGSIWGPKRIRTSDLLIVNQIPLTRLRKIRHFRDAATTVLPV